MKKLALLVFLLTIVSISIPAQESKQKKYEYVILLQKHWESPRVLEILYPDGSKEKFATLEGNDSGVNLDKNLATLLKAFNFLGEKGYQLTEQANANEGKTYIKWQYTFKREI